MTNFFDALYSLYPNIKRTVGDLAFDADGNEVSYDREAVKAKAQLFTVQKERASAYTEEADPLFFKAQRGEADYSEWLNKIEEIRERLPYPSLGE